MIRHLPAYLLGLVVGLLLLVFIVMPLAAVLVESFVVIKPMAPGELRAMTEQALGHVDPARRHEMVTRWVASATPQERIDGTAAALQLIGQEPGWDRRAAYDLQRVAAEEAVAALDPAARRAFDEQYPVALVMLHKRIPLAFQVRDAISEAEFVALRTGVHETIGFDHYLGIFTEPRLARAARNSILLALISSGLTTSLAFFVAYGINRGGVPFPNLVRYGALTPLVSPPVMIAFSAILLFGREGLVTRGLLDNTLGWTDADVANLYGIEGVLVAQTLSFLPAALIILDNVLARHDARLEEAAAIQGATAWQIFYRVTLPMCQPGLIRAAVLAFVLSMTDFANPLIIGQDFPVLAGILYDEMIGFQNTRLSAALAIWLIMPAITIYLLLERVGRKKRYDTGDGSGPSELPIPRSARLALTTLAYGVLLLIVIIYGSIVVGSFVRIWGIDYTFTLDWYTGEDVAGFVSGNRGMQYVWYSLKVALLAAPIGGLLAAVIAYLAERVRLPGRDVLSFVTMLPAVLPGVIFGVGYIVAFNLPFGRPELALTGTMSILVLNVLFANIFVGVLAGRAALQRLDASVDEAAEILGASLWQRFTRVVLPMIQHAALLGTLYIFIHAMTTLSAVIFLISPGNFLASFVIFDSVLNAYYGIACAMSVAILAIVFAAMAAMWIFERRGPVWARISASAAGRA